MNATQNMYRELARLRRSERPSAANLDRRMVVLLEIERRTGRWCGR